MTYYEKRGKRYYPVRDSLAYEGISNGTWLVVVHDGCTITRSAVEPNFEPQKEAAKTIKREQMVKILSQACEARPRTIALTEKQKEGLEAFRRICGEDKFLFFEYPSLYDIAEEIINLLTQNDPKNPNDN